MKKCGLTLLSLPLLVLSLNAEIELDNAELLPDADFQATSPSLQDRYLLGLKKRLSSERAMLTSVSLGDRALWLGRILETEALISAQKHLLNTPTAHTSLKMPMPIKEHRRPSWVPEGEMEENSLDMESIAKTPPWLPKWGRSLKQRREDSLAHSEKGTPVAQIQDQWTEYGDVSDRDPSRRVAPPELPFQESVVPHAVLPQVSEQTLAVENLNLSVPMPFRRGAWWLWESRDHNHWTKIRSGWADQNIAIGPLPEGTHHYVFTHEQRRPNEEPCHYTFHLDTTAPNIVSLVQGLDASGLTQLQWKISDREAHALKTSLTIFGNDDTIVATLGEVNAIGHYTLLREQRRDAIAIRLRSTDLAGNSSDAWIRYR